MPHPFPKKKIAYTKIEARNVNEGVEVYTTKSVPFIHYRGDKYQTYIYRKGVRWEALNGMGLNKSHSLQAEALSYHRHLVKYLNGSKCRTNKQLLERERVCRKNGTQVNIYV